jgi:hypothetical protein
VCYRETKSFARGRRHAAGDASIKSVPGEIDRIVFLGAAPNLSAEKLKSRPVRTNAGKPWAAVVAVIAGDDDNNLPYRRFSLRTPGVVYGQPILDLNARYSSPLKMSAYWAPMIFRWN